MLQGRQDGAGDDPVNGGRNYDFVKLSSSILDDVGHADNDDNHDGDVVDQPADRATREQGSTRRTSLYDDVTGRERRQRDHEDGRRWRRRVKNKLSNLMYP